MKKVKRSFLVILIIMTMAACGQNVPTWQEQYDLGVRYLEEGNYEEAIIAFTAAIEIDPKQPDAYLKAAEAYVALDDVDSAIDLLEDGLKKTQNEDIEKRLGELKKRRLPELTSEAKEAYSWCYQHMQAEEYRELFIKGNKMYEMTSDSPWFFRKHSEYYHICYDGTSLSQNLDGVGFVMLDPQHGYYGDLSEGVPNGFGVCFVFSYWTYDWSEQDPVSYVLFSGEWRDGRPNGYGTEIDMVGNIVGNQCCHVYEGNWVNGFIDGEVIDTEYINDTFDIEYRYACAQGKYVIDGRWKQDANGNYVLPASSFAEYSINLSYQSDRTIAFLGE